MLPCASARSASARVGQQTGRAAPGPPDRPVESRSSSRRWLRRPGGHDAVDQVPAGRRELDPADPPVARILAPGDQILGGQPVDDPGDGGEADPHRRGQVVAGGAAAQREHEQHLELGHGQVRGEQRVGPVEREQVRHPAPGAHDPARSPPPARHPVVSHRSDHASAIRLVWVRQTIRAKLTTDVRGNGGCRRLARLSLANRGLVALIAIIVTGVRAAHRSRRSSSSSSRRWTSRPRSSWRPTRAPRRRSSSGRSPSRSRTAVAGHRRAGEGHLDLARGRRHGPAASSRSAPTSTPRSPRCRPRSNRIDAQLPAGRRPAGARGQHRRLPGASCWRPARRATSSALADKLRRTVVPEIQGIDGRARGDRHRRPRPAARDHAEPGQGRRRRRRPRRAAPPRCGPTASPSRPAR